MFKNPTFVRDVPEIEIVDGLVHITTPQGEWYWLPSTFRAYVNRGRRKLDTWDLCQRQPVPIGRQG